MMVDQAEQGSKPKVAGAAQTFILMVISCLPVLGGVLIAPSLPRMAEYFHDVPNVGLLVRVTMTTPALMIALLGPLAGWMVEKFGRRSMISVTFLLYTLFGTAPLYLNDLHLIVLSRMALGATEALAITICTALMCDYYEGASRERMFAYQTAVSSLAASAFFIIGGQMGNHGWRVPFWLYVAGVVLIPFCLALLWEPRRRAVKVQAENDPNFKWSGMLPGYALLFCASVSMFVAAVELSFVLKGIGSATPGQIGMVMGVSHLALVIGALATRYSRAIGSKASLVTSFAFMAVGLLGISEAPAIGLGWTLVAVVLHSWGCGMAIPTVADIVMGKLPAERRAHGSGGYVSCVFFGQFAAPFIVHLISPASNLPGIQAIGIAILAIAIGLFLVFKPGTSPAAMRPE
ncbi:MFS transporter [Paraburkholderia sp. CNPSo 3155]|uniref:MFS transporter n=1 Tax=Paraburkholderia atlantica TaxID=2654982 RepID=UPI00128B6D1A|nr:MFS transporter [Paraburkholderia atlantica]MPW10959.1 MFS transporter [Paraburkholderia atlantica]